MTEAVIWRKMAAISAWISASVLSAAGAPAEGAAPGLAFSWSAGLGADEVFDFDLGGGCEIWTCRRGQWEG